MAIINPTLNPKASPLDPSVPGGMDSLPISNICGTSVCDGDIEEPIVIVPTAYTLGKEYVGTSEIDKPMNVQQYSIYHELDTGKNYYYDNGEWNEIPCCSGGGSSDFSTAQMTVETITGSPSNWSFNVAIAADDGIHDGVLVNTLTPMYITGIYELVLYKGAQVIRLNSDYVYDISGDITYDDSFGEYTVTGDCTIRLYTAGVS